MTIDGSQQYNGLFDALNKNSEYGIKEKIDGLAEVIEKIGNALITLPISIDEQIQYISNNVNNLTNQIKNISTKCDYLEKQLDNYENSLKQQKEYENSLKQQKQIQSNPINFNPMLPSITSKYNNPNNINIPKQNTVVSYADEIDFKGTKSNLVELTNDVFNEKRIFNSPPPPPPKNNLPNQLPIQNNNQGNRFPCQTDVLSELKIKMALLQKDE